MPHGPFSRYRRARVSEHPPIGDRSDPALYRSTIDDRLTAIRVTAIGAAGAVGAVAFLAVRLQSEVGTKPYFEDEAVAGLIAAVRCREVIHTVLWERGGSPLHFVLAHFVLSVWPTRRCAALAVGRLRPRRRRVRIRARTRARGRSRGCRGGVDRRDLRPAARVRDVRPHVLAARARRRAEHAAVPAGARTSDAVARVARRGERVAARRCASVRRDPGRASRPWSRAWLWWPRRDCAPRDPGARRRRGDGAARASRSFGSRCGSTSRRRTGRRSAPAAARERSSRRRRAASPAAAASCSGSSSCSRSSAPRSWRDGRSCWRSSARRRCSSAAALARRARAGHEHGVPERTPPDAEPAVVGGADRCRNDAPRRVAPGTRRRAAGRGGRGRAPRGGDSRVGPRPANALRLPRAGGRRRTPRRRSGTGSSSGSSPATCSSRTPFRTSAR